jgi:uncharacterized lipoprotein
MTKFKLGMAAAAAAVLAFGVAACGQTTSVQEEPAADAASTDAAAPAEAPADAAAPPADGAATTTPPADGSAAPPATTP